MDAFPICSHSPSRIYCMAKNSLPNHPLFHISTIALANTAKGSLSWTRAWEYPTLAFLQLYCFLCAEECVGPRRCAQPAHHVLATQDFGCPCNRPFSKSLLWVDPIPGVYSPCSRSRQGAAVWKKGKLAVRPSGPHAYMRQCCRPEPEVRREGVYARSSITTLITGSTGIKGRTNCYLIFLYIPGTCW